MNVSIKPDVKLTVHLDVFSAFSSIHLSNMCFLEIMIALFDGI
jgi:hypothetical protein